MQTHGYLRYWGKARPVEGAASHWHPFAYHSLDVAAVAAVLWQQSAAVRRALCMSFGASGPAAEAALGAWVIFFVALHDLGKLHALFQMFAPEASAESWPELGALPVFPQPDHYDHGADGFVVVHSEIADWTGARSRREREAFKVWLGAVMGHHGALPVDEDGIPKGGGKLRPSYAHPDVIKHDRLARHRWVEEAAQLFLAPAGLDLTCRPPKPNDAAHRLLAGFCSLCDWIGSNTDFFPYTPYGKAPQAYLDRQVEKLDRDSTLARIGILARIEPCGGVVALLRPHEQPRGVQVLVDCLPTEPALILVEAPTGSGKTEAALAHAWRLMQIGAAEGIVFALPTQATANAMLTRARAFAEQAFAGANVVLAHGHRAMNREFRRLLDAGRLPTAQGRSDAAVQCAEWLASSRKRVFLGQVGVCTVDQVLLSVLPIRHSFVRAFGISRAVLIIDEIHAYDAYMNGLLREVLRRHRAAGGHAILLSATLPADIRNDLVAAWGGPHSDDAPYPVVWRVSDGCTAAETLPASQRPDARSVAVETIQTPEAFPDDNLVQRVTAAAESGALVGIVCNLVQDAQRLAGVIRELTHHPVDLFHARFRLCDRQAIEEAVIRDYGRAAKRDQGRILVATQVIEQSLDLDFDWIITQLCPVDLLFQRIGRLHRHAATHRPVGFEQPCCTVLAPRNGSYGLHAKIYGDTRLLWRTEQCLAGADHIPFPGAYRDWIERVYVGDAWENEPETVIGDHIGYRQAQRAAADRALQLTRMSIAELRDEDEVATSLTRDGEMSLTVLPLLEGERLLDGTALQSLDDYERSEALMLHSVPVPHGWRGALSGCESDEDGRIKLVLQAAGADRWRAADGVFRYCSRTGLERAGREASRPGFDPAGAGN
jgi:CRISPR-associated endonuclease/helicase Cas3